MINCKIQPNGNLLLTAGNDARSELRTMRDFGANYWSIMADALESYSCNGLYTHFDAGNGDPFVGLTSAPCIAESMDYPDDGSRVIVGRLWYFSDYCLRSDLDELIARGRCEYTFILSKPASAQHPFYSLDDFARGYVEAMFFTNCDSGHERENLANDLGVERLTRASVAAIKTDCDTFTGHIMPDGCFVQQWLDRADDYDAAQAGRDFWFTRQRHGCGFWDREALAADLFEPLGCGGWQLRDDSVEQGPCRGNLRDALTTAAQSFGEKYVEIYRGWIHYR